MPKTVSFGDMPMSSFTVPDMVFQSSNIGTGEKSYENENMEKPIFLDLQKEKLEQAAIMAQSIIRGYLVMHSNLYTYKL